MRMMGEGPASLASQNTRWGALIVEELRRLGVAHFCVCPGSRSTPLAVAVAARPELPQRVMVDERGAAFFALGVGRASGRPAVLITTSGTAMANAYPAVIEAERSGVPLLLLSTDRPPELRESGANQTIDQVKLFGDRVRWYAEIPSPDSGFPPQAALTTLDEAVYRTRQPTPGPVHLNLLLREPLGPADVGQYPDDPALQRWLADEGPWTEIIAPQRTLSDAWVQQLTGLLAETRRGLVVAGDVGPSYASHAAQLARSLGWPLYSDISARTHATESLSLPMMDALLASPAFQAEARPEVILHIGGPVVSKRYLRWISEHPPEQYIHISDLERRHDPVHGVTTRLHADLGVLRAAWGRSLHRIKATADRTWGARLLRAGRAAQEAALRLLDAEPALTEPHIITTACGDWMPDVFLGNSMPIRDADTFGLRAGEVGVNRGASGIDGLIATALGWCTGLADRGALEHRRLLAIIGDVSALHDLSSFALLSPAASPPPMRLLIVNNGGGGIFSFLPVAGFAQGFETHFATAHGFQFEYIARAFGIPYRRVQTRAELTAVAAERPTHAEIVEIVTAPRDVNRALHAQIQQAAVAAAEDVLRSLP